MKRFLSSISLAALALAAPLPNTHLTVSGITQAQAQAQSAVTLEGVTFKGEVVSVTIPKITFEGTGATKAELEALFDPNGVATLGSRLARISARNVVIPLIEIRQDTPDAAVVTTYRDNVLRNIQNGVVAEFASATLATRATAKPGKKDFPGLEMNMANMVMKGFDLPLMFRFLFDKAQPGETLKVALAEQSVGSTTYKVGDLGTFSIKSIAARDIKLKPMKTPVAELIASAEKHSKEKTPESEQFALGMLSEMFGSMSFGDMSVIGMSGESKMPGKPPVKISLDQISGAGGADVAGRFQIKGLKVANGADTVGIGEIAIEGISMASMVGALAKLAESGGAKAADVDPAAFIPRIDVVRFAGIEIDVPDTNDAKQRIKAKLGLFETKMGNHVNQIPTNIAIALDKLQMDIPAATREKGLRDILDLGYKALDVSARYSQTWDEASKSLKLNEFMIRSLGMFTATAKADIGNVPRELFTTDKAVAAVAALGVAARSVDIAVTNEGLFEKLIAKQAKDSRLKPEDLRAQLAAGATMMVPMMLGNHPAAKPIGAALGKFVADPKNVKLSVKAKGEGIGATDFIAVSNPIELLDKVDIRATANE